MSLDVNRLILVGLTAYSIEAFSSSLNTICETPIRGLSKFINDVKTGKCSGKSVDKFCNNVLESVSTIKEAYGDDMGIRVSTSLKHSIEKMREYFSQISSDNPFVYHNDHLITPDVREFDRFYSDVTSSYRRINELMELSNKSLSLPALKDQYNLAFERIYKPLRVQLTKIMDDGNIARHVLYERVEDILCLDSCYGEPGEIKSDIRMIRNMFAHPDRIDRYDHYHIDVKGKVMDLYPNDLQNLNDCLVLKLMLVTFLSNVMLNLEMYRRVFEV